MATDSTPPVRAALDVLKRVPGTIAVTVLLLAVGALTGALWSSAEDAGLVDSWGWGVEAFAEGREPRWSGGPDPDPAG